MQRGFSNPHDTVTINDRSIVKRSVTENNGPVLFQPIFSSKGQDGVILESKVYDNFKAEFGEPDLRLYGQGLYQALNWLENGGVLKFIRLTATNATYANLLLLLHIKVVEVQKVNEHGDSLYEDSSTHLETTVSAGNSPIMTKKAQVKLSLESFTELTSPDADFETLMKTKAVNTSEEEKVLPLYLFRCEGKGKYGNSYRLRLVNQKNKDRDTAYRNYELEYFMYDGGLSVVDGTPITVTTYPSGRNSAGMSIYAADVVAYNDLPVKLVALEDSYYTAASMLAEVVNQGLSDDEKIDPAKVDILSFLDTTGAQYAGVEVDPDSVDLTAVSGYPLASGSDGDFDVTNSDRQDAMNDRLSDLFKGKIDPTINDYKEQPIDVALDACYPVEIKQQMLAWRDTRDDLLAIFDACLMTTVAAIKNFRQSDFTATSDWGFAIIPQHFKTYDKYNGKYITVTGTYLYSILLPQHLNAVGNYIPMAGIDYPLDEYILAGSLRPVISSEIDKSDLIDMGVNYIHKESGVECFGSQKTAYTKLSALSDINNVLVTYEIKQAVRELGPMFRFKFIGTDEDLATLNRIANQKLAPFNDLKCESATIELSRAATDPTAKTIKSVVEVKFKSIDEINDIVINIDR